MALFYPSIVGSSCLLITQRLLSPRGFWRLCREARGCGGIPSPAALVLAGCGYADFHVVVNFAINEFCEVLGSSAALAAFATIGATATVGSVGEGGLPYTPG